MNGSKKTAPIASTLKPGEESAYDTHKRLGIIPDSYTGNIELVPERPHINDQKFYSPDDEPKSGPN